MSELLLGEDLEKDYRTGPEVVRVLRGASVAVGSGEVVALVGASGVGKSTLLHVLGALDRPTAGRGLLEGEDLFGRGEAGLVRYRRHQIGFVFQFYNRLGEMTALENTMIPALLARRAVREARDLAAEALAEVGLGDRLRHRPGELSGGEQQRVALAPALINHPPATLGREPTGHLDPAARYHVGARGSGTLSSRLRRDGACSARPHPRRRRDRDGRTAAPRASPGDGKGGGRTSAGWLPQDAHVR